MQLVLDIIFLLFGYLLGSIPFGLIIVKIGTGKDVRNVESGRTGGTNAYRAAGIWAGVLTAFLDGVKGTLAVWLAIGLGGSSFAHVLAGIGAILGHNYSIFLLERGENGKLRLRGGAGGAPSVGGAIGLWFPSILFFIPGALTVILLTGYASVTTLAVPIIAIIIFAVRAYLGLSPWVYVLYGVFAEILLMWALRPNIKRLLDRTERMVGPAAKRQAARQSKIEAEKKK
jgi:glycerol-3-phosphate acyltransferase PlsY